ncbi:hypothetical protein A2U01_0103720, partial [Trifolium medium]|nr:hypothetical protein [Trifolium medium]
NHHPWPVYHTTTVTAIMTPSDVLLRGNSIPSLLRWGTTMNRYRLTTPAIQETAVKPLFLPTKRGRAFKS